MDEMAVLAVDGEAPIVGPDDELALAARTDPEAFGLLYRRHRLSVYRYLRSRTTSDDAAALVKLGRRAEGVLRQQSSGR